MASALTPDQLHELLATLLAGAAGKTHQHWSAAIGEVETLRPIHMHVRGNWRIHPRGTKADLRAIEAAVAVVRQEHPYVAS